MLSISTPTSVFKLTDLGSRLNVPIKMIISQQFIQIALDRNQLTGSTLFTDQIESRTGVRIEYRGRGRPVKEHE